MATWNKLTEKFECQKIMKFDNTVLVAQGDTKAEANKEMKDLKRLYYGIKLEKTKRGTLARYELQEHIDAEIEKQNESKT